MTRTLQIIITGLAVVVFSSGATALQLGPYSGSASFSSDQNPNGVINLPSFDTQGGSLTLTGVLVEFTHSGSVSVKADNDDPDDSGQATAKMARAWDAWGPGITGASGYKGIDEGPQFLDHENGDGGAFDATGPDGHDFGTLSFSNLASGSYNPTPLSLYESVGPSTVAFTVDPTNVSAWLSWDVAPDTAWQLEVQNPNLTVEIAVTYTYVPEPASLLMLGLGSLVMLRRRVA